MDSSSLRVYGGVEGDHRQAERRAQLIEAGLDLLGSPTDTPLTVRGVCTQAGLTARYFYENFADRDALTTAVYDHVIDEIARTTLEAVGAAPVEARAMARAGLGNIVRTVAEDPRKGRLVFSVALTNSLIANRRTRSARMFTGLLGGQAKAFYGIAESADLELATQFLVGGLAQTLTAWLDGSLNIEQHELVESCVELFIAIAERENAGH